MWLVIASTMSWCAASIVSTLEPSADQKLVSLLIAAISVPGAGVRTHHRLMKSSGKPADGPECSVPAIGCPGMRCTPLGVRAAIAEGRYEDFRLAVKAGWAKGDLPAI